MSYRTRILPQAARQIARWGLPDPVLVDVHLRLNDDLPHRPATKLTREEHPFEGMVYRFRMIDPANRLCEHFFSFQVFYGNDEQTLYVVRAAHIRSFGL